MNALRRAANVVRAGGVVAYATESVFGLGCDPRKRNAVMRLLRIKRRPMGKGLILISASIAQLDPYVQDLPTRARKTWPGPYTWLVDAKADTPRWLRGRHERIAVRVTAHRQAAQLCRLAGTALVSTSANRSGERPTRNYRETLRRLGARVDFVLPGRVGGQRRPSQIADAKTGKIIRTG